MDHSSQEAPHIGVIQVKDSSYCLTCQTASKQFCSDNRMNISPESHVWMAFGFRRKLGIWDRDGTRSQLDLCRHQPDHNSQHNFTTSLPITAHEYLGNLG